MFDSVFRTKLCIACNGLYLLALLTVLGCATHAKRLSNPRGAFYANDLETASKQLLKLNEKPKNDASVIELDLAMVEFFQGDIASAEKRLRNVRDTWDHLEQKSLSEAATSYLVDDKTRAYSGEDYERLLIRVMLTLCSLMRDGVDAESYSLQTLEKQRDLFERARLKWDESISATYCVPPIAPYLRGVLREATLSDYNEAARFYEQTELLLPDAPFVLADIARARHGVHSQPGQGVVYILTLVGRGPYKEEVTQRATQRALQVADVILSVIGEYSVPPTLAPVKVPQIVSPPKPFDLVGVEVNGVPVTTTMPITDVHRLATNSFQEKLPEIMARTIARRLVKKGAVYAAKDQLHATSDIASLALDAAGVLWEASESADTRCWGLLPREIQILRLELPSGTHQINLEPVTSGRPAGPAATCEVDVIDGKNTYVLSYWPNLQPIGKVLVSRQPTDPSVALAW